MPEMVLVDGLLRSFEMIIAVQQKLEAKSLRIEDNHPSRQLLKAVERITSWLFFRLPLFWGLLQYYM